MRGSAYAPGSPSIAIQSSVESACKRRRAESEGVAETCRERRSSARESAAMVFTRVGGMASEACHMKRRVIYA
eukprot:5803519-Alexandrium_andersonii.AAC.1